MNRRHRSLLLALAFIAFVSLGLPDGILGVAWPSIRRTFGVPLSQLGYILMAGTSGYFLASFFAGSVERRIGVGGVLLASNLLVLTSLLGNALAPAFYWMIVFGLLGGLGAGAIDAAMNHFVAASYSPRWVSWLHACYGIGATLGPLIMTTVLVRGLSWRYGYASVGVIIGAMSILFLLTIKLWQADQTPEVNPMMRAGVTDALRLPLVWMHIALFFLYTGIEVTGGQWFYSLFTESRDVAEDRRFDRQQLLVRADDRANRLWLRRRACQTDRTVAHRDVDRSAGGDADLGEHLDERDVHRRGDPRFRAGANLSAAHVGHA